MQKSEILTTVISCLIFFGFYFAYQLTTVPFGIVTVLGLGLALTIMSALVYFVVIALLPQSSVLYVVAGILGFFVLKHAYNLQIKMMHNPSLGLGAMVKTWLLFGGLLILICGVIIYILMKTENRTTWAMVSFAGLMAIWILASYAVDWFEPNQKIDSKEFEISAKNIIQSYCAPRHIVPESSVSKMDGPTFVCGNIQFSYHVVASGPRMTIRMAGTTSGMDININDPQLKSMLNKWSNILLDWESVKDAKGEYIGSQKILNLKASFRLPAETNKALLLIKEMERVLDCWNKYLLQKEKKI